jgi:hypothetical protein
MTFAKSCWADLEQRGLKLSSRILFVTDGGKGIIKALRHIRSVQNV